MSAAPAPLRSLRQPRMDSSDFQQIAQILKRKAGLTLAADAQKLVLSRLSKRILALRLCDFSDYLHLITGPEGEAELAAMIDALTTNTTRFFREPEHFEILERVAMPRLIRKARAGRRVRLWSAACSSGEEPYSIAATVARCFPDASRFDLKILATDINRQVLRIGAAARYEARIAAGIPETMRRLMFAGDEDRDEMQIRPALRDLVTFRYLNFVDPWPVSGPFDIIFCRNVAIYMDTDMQQRLWSGLERVLDQDGLLFIGHSERLGTALSDRLTLFAPTAFRRPYSETRPPARTKESL